MLVNDTQWLASLDPTLTRVGRGSRIDDTRPRCEHPVASVFYGDEYGGLCGHLAKDGTAYCRVHRPDKPTCGAMTAGNSTSSPHPCGHLPWNGTGRCVNHLEGADREAWVKDKKRRDRDAAKSKREELARRREAERRLIELPPEHPGILPAILTCFNRYGDDLDCKVCCASSRYKPQMTREAWAIRHVQTCRTIRYKP